MLATTQKEMEGDTQLSQILNESKESIVTEDLGKLLEIPVMWQHRLQVTTESLHQYLQQKGIQNKEDSPYQLLCRFLDNVRTDTYIRNSSHLFNRPHQ